MGILFAHRAKKPRPHAKAKDKISIKQWESSPDMKLNFKKCVKKMNRTGCFRTQTTLDSMFIFPMSSLPGLN